MATERRRTIRYPLVASAELSEEKSQTHLSARVTELSLYGCYFDAINPFPVSTRIVVKIVSRLVFFEAHGTVVYFTASSPDGRCVPPDPSIFLESLKGLA
jgi:hypothetical protein